MTQWEYKIHFEFTEGALNALGREGWEAVGLADTDDASGDTSSAGRRAVLLKREVAHPSPGSAFTVKVAR